MFAICDHGVLRLARSARLAGLAACALFAAACHGGLDNPVSPNVSTDAAVSAPSGDETASTLAAPVDHDMPGVGASGYSGTCTIAAARNGFRLKAQGQGTPGTTVRFHLIRADGYRTTAFADVGNSGQFRTGQELVTDFPPGIQVTCELYSLADVLLAQSETFVAP